MFRANTIPPCPQCGGPQAVIPSADDYVCIDSGRMLAFAHKHDWGYDAAIVEGGIMVGTDVRHPNGHWSREYSVQPDMTALRRWAGY